jgi:hypothetical protein
MPQPLTRFPRVLSLEDRVDTWTEPQEMLITRYQLSDYKLTIY